MRLALRVMAGASSAYSSSNLYMSVVLSDITCILGHMAMAYIWS